MVKEPTMSGLVAVFGILLGAALTPAVDSWAQTTEKVGEYLAANCTREEYSIPMRDGARLFTVVFVPLDTSKTYPILLERTPFGAWESGGDYNRGTLGPNLTLIREGYIVVRQEVRGTNRSDGVFSYLTAHITNKRHPKDVDESTDTYDTIEWLLANVPRHNGRVGMWGTDYAGFSVVAGMIDAHPALKAVSPQAPVTDPWFDAIYSGGAFKLADTFRFISNFGQTTSGEKVGYNALSFKMGLDSYRFFLDTGSLSYVDRLYLQGRRPFWNECAAHPAYDAFWQSRNILPLLKKTAPAVMTVGGWFDDENLGGAVACYHAIEERNPDAFNVLVIGPWDHAGWVGRYDGQDGLGNVAFGSNTAAFYQENIELAFFDHFLKGRGRRTLPEAYVFETGGNVWRAFDRWPPKESQAEKLYFAAGGGLSSSPPAGSRESWDEFVSDPANPVPVTGRASPWPSRGFMVADQRFVVGRHDVLVYATPVLDHDVTIAGPLKADLWVSTSQEDADWIVKLVDIFPSQGDDRFPDRPALKGYHMLVRTGVLRGRYRTSIETPEPFVADMATKITVGLADVCHTFRKGHRIMVHVQSSWFPFFDRNPQKYVDNIFGAADADFVEATHRVYRSAGRASYLEFGVLKQP
jgi:putative CocE/NonD family hydrolase